MTIHIDYFPHEFLEMQEEIQNHPDLLLNLLQLTPGAEFEEKFAVIATYCDMVLDGLYDNTQLIFLCKEVTMKLKVKRGWSGRDYVNDTGDVH